MARPSANRAPVYSEAGLTEWPTAPAHLSKEEAKRWNSLGCMALAVGGVTRGDLLVIERLAQVGAALDRALKERKIKPSVVSQLSRVETTLLRETGLTRRGRKDLPKPPPPKSVEQERLEELFGQ
jgi:hypothetical protein